MSFLDTLFVDGHEIRGITGLSVVGAIRGLWAPGERRGDDEIIPGAGGEQGAELPLASFVIEIPIRIVGASRAERNDNLRAAGALIGGAAGNGLVQLKRRVATGVDEDNDYLEGLAKGRYITGLSMDVVNPYSGRASLQYLNLVGGWNPGSGVYEYP